MFRKLLTFVISSCLFLNFSFVFAAEGISQAKETDAYQIPGGYLLPSADDNPKIDYQFQNYDHGGWGDNGISDIYSLWYTFNSKGEKDILVVVEHDRTYETFGSGNFYYFKVTDITVHHTNPPILSKNHLPKLIYKIGDKVKLVKMDKIAFLGPTGIVLRIKSSTLDEVFDASKVRLEIFRKDGTIDRIMIPRVVIKQWKTVMQADLKKVKGDIYNQ